MVQVTLPEMGESVTEGSIVEWLRKVGETVAEGDPLVSVTTDKVDVEVPATASGVITELRAKEGDTVAVGAVLAEIDTSAKSAGNGAPAAEAPKAAETKPAGPPKIVDVTLPERGESVTEGSIVEWLKKPGDAVAEGDPLVSVTTDKVDVEVSATTSGVVTAVLAKEGETVAVGAVLAQIDANAAATPKPVSGGNGATKTPPPPAAKPAPAPVAAPSGQIVATHQARRAARKLNVAIDRVKGSGPNGLILQSDVKTQAPGLPASTATAASGVQLPPLPAETKTTQLKGPAAALAGYMEQSLTVPTATSFRTLAVDVMDARRRELNAAIKSAGRSEKISFTHIIAYALVHAARELPFITYSFRRDGNAPLRVEPGVNLGLAVDAERKDGTRFEIGRISWSRIAS